MKKSILLIDEDRTGCQFLIDAINQAPVMFNHIIVKSAEQGLRVLKRQSIDLVFARYNMPAINGLIFVSAVKSYRKFWSKKVYLYDDTITEYASKLANRLGASGCIERTTDVATLGRQVKAILNPELLPNFVFFQKPSEDPIRMMIELGRPSNELTLHFD